jgi:hypothetical protein
MAATVALRRTQRLRRRTFPRHSPVTPLPPLRPPCAKRRPVMDGARLTGTVPLPPTSASPPPPLLASCAVRGWVAGAGRPDGARSVRAGGRRSQLRRSQRGGGVVVRGSCGCWRRCRGGVWRGRWHVSEHTRGGRAALTEAAGGGGGEEEAVMTARVARGLKRAHALPAFPTLPTTAAPLLLHDLPRQRLQIHLLVLPLAVPFPV